MIELTLANSMATSLKAALLAGEVEHCAILLATEVKTEAGHVRLLVQSVIHPEPEDYQNQAWDAAELSPLLVAAITKRAKREKLSIVFVHSHPGSAAPEFSAIDDEGEKRLAAFFSHRHPGFVHGALVISKGGWCARILGTQIGVRVVLLGDERQLVFDPGNHAFRAGARFDRQVRAFGAQGQRMIENLIVAIVGLGGTGSITAQQLVHLGVRNFILIDPDVIELTNLNRVVGAGDGDVGAAKVNVAENYIRSVAPTAQVLSLNEDIIKAKSAKKLLDANLIFGCTDSHGSRSVLNQISYQYFIPTIDMGSVIAANAGFVTGIFGRVQLLGPDQPCLQCCGLLDSEEIRRDMLTAYERQQDPYIQGEREPAPSVVSLNGTVASLAITMFMSFIIGIPSAARHLLYDGRSSKLRSVRASVRDNCFICSSSGVYGRGDRQILFARQD